MTFMVGRVAWPIPRSVPLWASMGVILVCVGVAVWTRKPDLPYVTVAFVGNSMMYYNDLPRLLERLGEGHIQRQDSCLHGSSSFPSMLIRGNGMYGKWETGNARFQVDDDVVGDGGALYDYGACTVAQLFFGYDANLDQRVAQANNNNNQQDDNTDADDFFSFYDGQNPCLESDIYYTYLNQKYAKQGTPQWNFVVMNDNTRNPARTESRASSLAVLESTYLPWFLTMGSTPILVSTYAYWSPYRDMSGLVDVPTFTSLTYDGYLDYAAILAEHLPEDQQPRIAKVGWAFLLVYEEQYQMWTRLFHVDKIHPSPLGSYLQSLIIYHTIFGRLPPRDIALRPDSSSMWDDARRFAPPNHRRGTFPTPEEEAYIYNVAVRICVYGVTPSSLVLYENGASVDVEHHDDLYRVDDIF